jgi:hypothetical protein
MHKEKVSKMQHHGFFHLEHKRNILFGDFSWMLIFKNISNDNLLAFFY